MAGGFERWVVEAFLFASVGEKEFEDVADAFACVAVEDADYVVELIWDRAVEPLVAEEADEYALGWDGKIFRGCDGEPFAGVEREPPDWAVLDHKGTSKGDLYRPPLWRELPRNTPGGTWVRRGLNRFRFRFFFFLEWLPDVPKIAKWRFRLSAIERLP